MIWTIFIGLIVGALAKLLMPGRDLGGFIITIIIGIVGAILAGWLGAEMGIYSEGQPAGFIASVLGGMLLIFIYRIVVGRKA